MIFTVCIGCLFSVGDGLIMLVVFTLYSWVWLLVAC